MKKIILAVLVAVLVNVYSIAQNAQKDSYTFKLNGKEISPKPNIDAVTKAYRINIDKVSKERSKLFIIQFDKLPKLEEQAKLKKAGICLLSYVASNAYFARVEPSFFMSNGVTKNLRSIIDIQPEYKISEQLTNNNVPEYAKDKTGKIKVVVSYFENTEEEQILIDLQKLNISKPNIFAKFNQLEISVVSADLLKLASLAWIQNIEPISPPSQFDNRDDRTSHKVNVLNSSVKGLGYGLTGKNVKIGLWDGDVDHHRDFNGRVVSREFEMHSTDHGTHTCGTIAGAGLLDPLALGMAPEATVYAWNFNYQSNGLNNAQERYWSLDNDGIEITSNSFGYSLTSCPNKIAYNASDKMEDYLAYAYPYFLFVYSAGNSQDVCPDGFHTTTKNIKNSLVVANIDNQDKINWSSSFGPSFDGRLMPNISGVGTDVYSTYLDNKYGSMTGTSMATPGVAGTMALVYQRYKETHGGDRPISSLMRALACNTAHDLGNPGPDYKYGYGVINGLRAVDVMEHKSYFIDSVSQGGQIKKDIIIPKGAVGLRVMLAWTDIYGTPGVSVVLVNDLDLKVKSGGVDYLPWILDPTNPAANASRGMDKLNNIEQVTIDNPVAGKYTIVVDGSSIPVGVQQFAVVYDVVMPELKLTYPIGGENLTPKTDAVISWDYEGENATFSLEYSIDNGNTYKEIAANLPSDVRHYVWNVPVDQNVANAKVRVSTAKLFSETKESFSIMSIPQNVKVAQAECGVTSYTMTWDAVDNAVYKVYKLKGQVYELLADVETNSCQLSGLTSSNDNYFCVRAVDKKTGAISERSLAVMVNPVEHYTRSVFKEDFSKQKAANFYFKNKNGLASIQYVNTEQTYGLRLEGPSLALATSWNEKATKPAECFSNNPEYVVKAGICNIDASDLAGKKMMLTFDYRQKYRSAIGTSYFRVSVNGKYLANVEGVEVYDGANAESYQTVRYDLSAFAGNSSVSVEFEAVCKTGYTTYVDNNGNYNYSDDALDKGDFVAIDNIVISESPLDVALSSVEVSKGFTTADKVTVGVKNHTLSAISNIPVSYKLNNKKVVKEIIAGPIAPSASLVYSFEKTVDLSAEGKYSIKSYIAFPNDSVKTNDTLSTVVLNDKSVRMGLVTGTISTDYAVFTDHGGKFENYSTNDEYILTFKPKSLGKRVKVSFSEFDVETGYDFLSIYNGPSTDSPLIGVYDGSSLPPSFISSSAGGELTFKFIADNYNSLKGWQAIIESVDKDAVDATIVNVLSPIPLEGLKTNAEEIQVEVGNKGTEPLRAFDLYYQINESTPVKESFTGEIPSGESVAVSFATKADLSAVGTYVLKTWVVTEGDTASSNNAQTVNVVNLGSVVDVAISSVDPLIPRRASSSSISGEIENLGTVTVSNVLVGYKLNDGESVTQTIVDPIAPGQKVSFVFADVDLTAAASYKVDLSAVLEGDTNEENNKTSLTANKVTPSATNVFGSFDGYSTLVTAPAIPAMNLTNNYTVECWANLQHASTFGRLFDKSNVSLFYQTHYSMVYPDNSMILNVTTEGGTFTYYYTGVVANLLNSWHHYALTVSDENKYTLYIDGVVQTPVLYGSGKVDATKANSTKPFLIGNRADLTRGVNGAIDEVRVWNSCLNQTTIQANAITDYAANTAGLLAYYKFKEGTGNYLFDYSNNDNTAIVTGNDVTANDAGLFWLKPTSLLKDFHVSNEKIPTVFDEASNTFTTIMDNADLAHVTPRFSTIQQSVVKIGTDIQTSGVEKDFSAGSVVYTVEGVGFNEGISQTYTVNFSNDLRSDCELTAYSFESGNNSDKPQLVLDKTGDKFYKKVTNYDVSALKASFAVSSGAKLYINNELQTSPQLTAIDYTKPVLVRVEAENGRSFKNYLVDIDTRSSLADLTAFSIDSNKQLKEAAINSTDKSIVIYVKKGTDLTVISPSFTVSDKAVVYVNNISQISGVTCNNFSSPLVYEIESEDQTVSKLWNVLIVNDTIAPVVKLLGNAKVSIGLGIIYTDAGATATDNVDGDISNSIVTTGSVDVNNVGVYTLTYKVTDASGNVNTVTRTVEVSNATAIIGSKNNNSVSVYPNPVSDGFIYVEKKHFAPITVEITDVSGIVLLKQTRNELISKIDVASLLSGLYIIKIKNTITDDISTFKFIIK